MTKIILRGRKRKTPFFLKYLTHANTLRLKEIEKRFSALDEDQKSAALTEFNDILDDVRIGGIWKKTEKARLPRTESILISRLQEEGLPEVQVLDLGASDGSTSLDLLHALTQAGIDVSRFVAADLFNELLLYQFGGVREFRSRQDDPVLLSLGPLGFRLPTSEHPFDVINNIVARTYLALSSFRKRLNLVDTISLLSPEVAKNPKIEFIELDCLVRDESLREGFTVVRASNLLNKNYFSPDQLRLAVHNIVSYLKVDGLLLISRNVPQSGEEVEQLSLWKKATEKSLVHLLDENGGSEVRGIAL